MITPERQGLSLVFPLAAGHATGRGHPGRRSRDPVPLLEAHHQRLVHLQGDDTELVQPELTQPPARGAGVHVMPLTMAISHLSTRQLVTGKGDHAAAVTLTSSVSQTVKDIFGERLVQG